MAHEHHHEEENGIRESVIRIVLGTVFLIAAYLVERNTDWATWQYLIIYMVPYLICGWDTLKEAGEAILEGEAMDENFLMAVATLGALAIGFLPNAEPQFTEAVFVMLFFQLGELFETIAEGRSRRSISHLLDIRPDTATIERDGQYIEVRTEEVVAGDIVVITAGGKVPADGTVIEGSSSIDTVALTGESVPRTVREGDEILSGCINLSGVLRVRAEKPASESAAARILELVENAAGNKSGTEKFITRFARIYTPIVVVLALIIALLPPLFGGQWSVWIYRALMFLIVSCPCALVISVPLSYFGGIGGASSNGVLIKGASFMDTLSRVRAVVFDKTGTLTEGVFTVTAVHPDEMTETELLHIAAHVERHSSHPIAAALRDAYPNEKDDCDVAGIVEHAGKGVSAKVNGREVSVGNEKMMEELGIQAHRCHLLGTVVHVAVDGRYEGHVVISDRIKEDALNLVPMLHSEGVSKVFMLTGDSEPIAKGVADSLSLDGFKAGLLPEDKVKAIEEMLPEGPVAFTGDGINDAPVLMRADIGIAMGALGSDAAIEAADVVIMDDKPSKIVTAIRIARRTLGIARENVIFAIAVKILVLILATIGVAHLWMAVFADVGVTILCILNSMRTLYFSRKS